MLSKRDGTKRRRIKTGNENKSLKKRSHGKYKIVYKTLEIQTPKKLLLHHKRSHFGTRKLLTYSEKKKKAKNNYFRFSFSFFIFYFFLNKNQKEILL